MSANKRSSFLNILTILSFVGIALFIAGGIFTVVVGKKIYNEKFSTVEKYDAARNAVASMYPDEEEREAALAVFEKQRYIKSTGILMIIGQIFCLLGVIKMRKLNKEGFALYAIGELGVPIASGVFLGFLSAIGGLFIGLVMLVLYGTRLGEMSLFRKKLA